LGLDLKNATLRRGTSRRAPFSGWDTLSTPARHPLVAGISVVLHVVLLLLLLLSPRIERKSEPREARPSARPVQMMYLPPEPPKERARPRAKPAPAELGTAEARPVEKLPSPTTVEVPDLPRHDEAAAMSPHPSERIGAVDRSASSGERATTESAETEEDAMVSEARRLFGPAPAGTSNLAGPVQTGLPLPYSDGGTRCVWGGAEVKPIEHPAHGVIEGIVRTERGGLPIPGAFLQMLGTGSATFSDAAGHYRLTFDPTLVDACRSQLVRVTAPGYRARTMVLTYGPPSANVVDLEGRF
jgi:hypothetical protein